MVRNPGALTAGDAARLTEAFALLKRGRTAEASAIAREVASVRPDSPDSLHMLALCRKAEGDAGGAVDAFEAALARAPDDPRILGNFANLLARIGRTAEAIALHRRALGLAPGHADGWMNLGLALLDAGDAKAAQESLERAVRLQPASAAAWQGLGAARRKSGDLTGAEAALRRAVEHAPASGGAWTSLGVVRRLRGDPEGALQCYAAARRAGGMGPALLDAEASASLDAGEPERALALARQLTASAPDYVAGQLFLAQLLWEHGAGQAPEQDAIAVFRGAVDAQPGHRELRKAFIRFLIDANAADQALEQVRSLRRDFDEPGLAATEAQALEMLGDATAAGRLLAAAYPALRTNPGFLNMHARHLLAAGNAEAAAERAQETLELESTNQQALAFLGVAWRLLGDAREEWLCGYDRLIAEVAVEPPPGFTDEAQFLAALEATLAKLHTARSAPVNQSLRGGSQTSGMLFGRRDPLIAATRDALERAVLKHVERLPADPDHPFLRRKSGSIRFVGSWSVRLQSSGRHVNHFHQEGWMSSAYYVSLPPSVQDATDTGTAGFIQFGQPPEELRLNLAPRRVIHPRAGRLVLFPSYLWHGTVPFVDAVPRLTVAFDLVPEGPGAAGR